MPTRRDLLRWSAAAAAGALLPRALFAQDAAARRKALEQPLPLRALGATGREVSQLGLGCYYLGNVRDTKQAERVIARAFDLGVTYFDTAPSYNRGTSEERVGRVLAGKRDKVFIATKSTHDDGKSALEELEGSLKRLQSDHVDLFQFHALATLEEVETVFGEGGAYEAIAKAKQDGKVRHIGFSGHKDPAVNAAVARDRPVETVLLPLNPVDPHRKSFEKGALPAATKRGLGIIAMKLFASGKLLGDPALSPTPEECVRYALTLPVSTAIVGCSTVEELEIDLAAAKTFEPLDDEAKAALVARTQPFVARKIEWYKR